MTLYAKAANDAVWFHAEARDEGCFLWSNNIYLKRVESQKYYSNGVIGIEGAVDNAWWPALKAQLLAHKYPSPSSMEEDANWALAYMHCWIIKNKLRSAHLKTKSIVLTKKLKCNNAVLHVNSEKINLVGKICLLYLTIDRKLTFILHVVKACEKAINIYKEIARAAKVSLKVLTSAKIDHPLAQEDRRDLSEIFAEGRTVCLFRVRAHKRIGGNERADELAKCDAITKKTTADYDRFALSYAKKMIRVTSSEE
ncbi:hypothetical protein EVAR_7093_1 [Eumeta japonica]|uniref:RNase H type-1 domain-containing protein n=1 Tax=Eumeta variegata TaxID=151549 RepID=A0A4C1YBU2_EUMVA|nr:hypothetical protein EVAR_7093_1 [Eumeta japonica]